MFDLPLAGSLGHDLLEEQINKEGYFQSKIIPGFWKHKDRALQSTLIVNDFGIKYIKREDLDHLIQTLEKYYSVVVDLEGKECIKINLDLNYDDGKVHFSMHPYLTKALIIQHSPLTKSWDSP